MPVRSGFAVWEGTLKNGTGSIRSESGAINTAYSYGSRFLDQKTEGTNPDELIAAAHSGCYSMMFSLLLEQGGYSPSKIQTTAKVHLDRDSSGFTISKIDLQTQAAVPDIQPSEFQRIANLAKESCPVSRALKSVPITLEARIVE